MPRPDHEIVTVRYTGVGGAIVKNRLGYWNVGAKPTDRDYEKTKPVKSMTMKQARRLPKGAFVIVEDEIDETAWLRAFDEEYPDAANDDFEPFDSEPSDFF